MSVLFITLLKYRVSEGTVYYFVVFCCKTTKNIDYYIISLCLYMLRCEIKTTYLHSSTPRTPQL